MKLWQKITLICAAVLMLIVGVCGTLMLLLSRNAILKLTLDNVLSAQMNLNTSFIQMVSYYGDNGASPVAKRSMAQYCFTRFAETGAVLVGDGETICSDVTLQPEAILPLPDTEAVDGEQQYYTGVVSGRHVVIAGSQTRILGGSYAVYVVRDISAVYEELAAMLVRFIIIGAAGIALGAGLTVILARHAAKPLGRLAQSARRIAKGEYAERAVVAGRDETAVLATDFNAMAEAVQRHIAQLEETAQRQQLFIAGLTHEFKTPLTSVIGHSETLLYTRMAEEAAANSLNHIREQCGWLERLTQKLLALVTLEQDITLKETSVDALLEAVRISTEEAMRQRGVTLKTKCETDFLRMDSDLMRSALVNLAENAAKASAPGQTVLIRAYGNTLAVSDEGSGIPREEIPHITEPFYRVDKSRSKRSGGSGLGLALVQRITDAHRARLEIESAPGAGTTVRIVFPQ